MKKNILLTLLICLMQTLSANAQKKLYIPNEWLHPWPSDSLLYKEVDTDNKYTWSKSRSKESENFIVYWDKYYGNTIPTNASSTYKVDIDDLLKKAEGFYALNVGKLGFCDESNSKVSKYKMMILVNHTTEWICYGGGYDNTIGALWLSPSTCKPVGHSVAHEVGHSFQYQCYSDLGGNAGFRGAIGSGSTFWEQTAQWQANQAYPELKWDQSWGIFKNTANYAMTHEWMRYQSYWWHYYLTEKYGIDMIGKIWRHQVTHNSDPNEVFMNMMGYGAEELYKEYFDYAMKMATLDLDVCRDEAAPYIGSYTYNFVTIGGTKHQVAYSSCPQSTGFNVIPLSVPTAGTEISTDFTSLKTTATLADGDPAQYFNGESKFVNFTTSKKFYNCYSTTGNKSTYNKRGFRLGYVALLNDGTRQYLYEDKVYCADGGTGNCTETVSAVVPEGTKRLFLVVVPAPSVYHQHKWDNDTQNTADMIISNDDQWPYTVEFSGTNIAGIPTIKDGMPISDVTLTYDVYLPKSTSDYAFTSVTVSDDAAAALGTAFQMMPGDIAGKMVSWASSGPKDGKIMFYAVNANGNISNTGSSANGYGHWFGSTGNRSDWSSGYLFSEFDPSSLTFKIGQYPNKVTNNKDYTIRQAMKYVRGSETAVATFVFNVHIQSGKTGGELSAIEKKEIDTGIVVYEDEGRKTKDENIYTLDGRLVKNLNNYHGLYIKNGKKNLK